MKRGLIFIILLLPALLSAQRIEFSIEIDFQLIVPAKHVYVFKSNESKIDTLPYPVNNTLHIKGEINQPGIFQIATDSSASYNFWVDNNPVLLSLSEERTKRRNTLLKISKIDGSADTKLLFQMTVPRTSTWTPPLNSTPEERKSHWDSVHFNYAYHLIDSLITVRNFSPIIPFYIRFYENVLKAEAVSSLYRRLPDESQNSEQGQKVKIFLERSILLQKGTVIENFIMMNPKGKAFSLHSVSAKFILLDFWASWCGPCRAENPDLAKLYNKYKKKGFEIIGISLDDNKTNWLKAIKKDNLNWYHISDLKGWQNSFASKYKVAYVPFTVLLDSNYRVIATSLRSNQIEEILMRE